MFYQDVCGRGTTCQMPCPVDAEMPRLRLLCPQPRSWEGQRSRCDASQKLAEWTSAVWLSNQRGVRGQGTKLGVKRLLPSDCRPSNQGLHILWLWGHIVLVPDAPLLLFLQ